MKFIIIENGKPKEVRQRVYEKWIKENRNNYDLPFYTYRKEGKVFTIDTEYEGTIDENGVPLPFVLFHFEDEETVNNGRTSPDHVLDCTEYFDSFVKLKKRRSELIKRIEASPE